MKKYDGISYEAFPKYLANHIEEINGLIDFETELGDSEPFEITIGEEKLFIPYRIYCDEPVPGKLNNLNDLQKIIFHCYYTRHHNGFVRQRHLEEIVLMSEEWIIPYIVQLIGEYVREINIEIREKLDQLNSLKYIDFINQNKHFYFKTKQRVISYWDC